MALDSGLFATMMFSYNVVENHNKGLFTHAHQQKIGTFAMKPLAGGFIPDARRALRYIAANPHVNCLLVGMSSPAEIEANVMALDEGPLAPEETRQLEQWAAQAGYEFCRRCGYCLPCPQGIDIPTVFLLEGYYDRYELQGWALERYRALSTPASACRNCGLCEVKCPYLLPITAKLAKADKKLAGD
ncbi:MAG: 4Fe-4S dicluster domain-containing protein [Clostridia bacterium]|nr:4Fe-4S dicluster domain-containing protein [Clostridia bacterium]